MSWQAVPLRGAAEVTLGRQRAPQHESGPDMVPYLRAANVKDGQLDLGDVLQMNFGPSEQAIFALRPGDVLVTEGSGSRSAVGASAVWRGEIDGMVCYQNTLLRLRPRHGVDGRYLEWWARSAFASGMFAAVAGGANIYHLSAERVRALQIELPPLDEQRRIADFLDGESARIDRIVDARRRQRCILDERRFAVISDGLVLGVLDAPVGAWPWTWLPRVGVDSPLVRLGYVCRLQGGLTVDGTRDMGNDAVTRPYLRVANVQAGSLDLGSVSEITVPKALAARSTLRPGDVLMTEGGDLDKLGRGTVWHGELPACLHQNHVFVLRPEPEKLDSDYLALMTQTIHGRCYFESTGVKTTNLASTNSSKILGFPVPLPSIERQRATVRALRDALGPLDRTAAAIDQQLSLLAERRRAVTTAAVTGRMDVATAYGVGVA